MDVAPQLPKLLHSYLNNHNKNSYTVLESNMRKSIKEMKLRQDRILIVIVLIFIVMTLTRHFIHIVNKKNLYLALFTIKT